jgi:hypothetical protein
MITSGGTATSEARPRCGHSGHGDDASAQPAHSRRCAHATVPLEDLDGVNLVDRAIDALWSAAITCASVIMRWPLCGKSATELLVMCSSPCHVDGQPTSLSLVA